MRDEFTCPNCFCQSVVYPDMDGDDEPVRCRTCGTLHGTLSQFRRNIELRSTRARAVVSGC